MVSAGGVILASDMNDAQFWRTAFSSFSSTAQPALVSASGAEGLVTSVAADFRDGYAYEIGWQFRVQVNGGTSPFYVAGKLFRNNSSGTLIDASGGEAVVTTNFMLLKGSTIVKRTTGSNTTQTIALTASFSGSGSPTSLDIEASSTSRTRLVVRPIGLATDYSGAIEVPTS